MPQEFENENTYILNENAKRRAEMFHLATLACASACGFVCALDCGFACAFACGFAAGFFIGIVIANF